VLRVDGTDLDTKKIPHTIAFVITDDETFDVGVDTRSGVNDADYHVPFRFTGTINKLTVKPGPEQFTENDRKVIQHALAGARD
jgi:arylsulfatase